MAGLRFEDYTEKANRVIFVSRYEASQFGSPYIETEHLLLAITREDPALLQRVLEVDPKALRDDVEERVPPWKAGPPSVDLPLSLPCNRVLAYAAEKAVRASRRNIEPAHLLLGLLREEESLAAEILRDHGVGIESARERINKPIAESGLYCPRCERPAQNPLTCGDCSSVICRVCGTPLESSGEAATG